MIWYAFEQQHHSMRLNGNAVFFSFGIRINTKDEEEKKSNDKAKGELEREGER